MVIKKPSFMEINRTETKGTLAIFFGSVSALLNMAVWYLGQGNYGPYEVVGSAPGPLGVLRFYFLQSLSLIIVVVGLLYLRRGLFKSRRSEPNEPSLTVIISDVMASKRDVRIGIVGGVAYALFYSVLSAILVYQPGVDFTQAYNASGPGWNAIACCGSFGTVPILIGYLPQFHFGVQLLPLDLLFVAVIPILMGLNLAVVSFAMRNRPTQGGGKWLGAIGGSVGLFTGCPTCAGFFLSSVVGGFGAATLAGTLAAYQILFVAITIPVLVFNPLLVASRLKRARYWNCEVSR